MKARILAPAIQEKTLLLPQPRIVDENGKPIVFKFRTQAMSDRRKAMAYAENFPEDEFQDRYTVAMLAECLISPSYAEVREWAEGTELADEKDVYTFMTNMFKPDELVAFINSMFTSDIPPVKKAKN